MCDHNGTCSGRLDLEPPGLKVRVICDDCGVVVVVLDPVLYTLDPILGIATA